MSRVAISRVRPSPPCINAAGVGAKHNNIIESNNKAIQAGELKNINMAIHN
jgi:hypothetical protein